MLSLLLFISFISTLQAFWSTPCQQPVYVDYCRCQRYNPCGGGGYPPSGTGQYAVAQPRVRGWEGGEEGWREERRITKPPKFVFVWSDEEEEEEVRRPIPRKKIVHVEEENLVIPPSMKRPRPSQKKTRVDGDLDAKALLELDSAEIEKGRIKSKTTEEEDLWTDSETPSKGTLDPAAAAA
ncbi:hypothetical protein PFISCL1PPCAC_6308, partial [Pristionchus fissidentatus]